jgi:hypothetical protein
MDGALVFLLAGGVVGSGCVEETGGAFRLFSLALNLFGGTPKRARGTRALHGVASLSEWLGINRLANSWLFIDGEGR